MSSFTSLRNPARWFMNWLYGTWNDVTDENGKTVTSERALSYAPIWYGCQKIAGHVSQLPICVFRRVDGGGEKQKQHSVSRLMRRPNTYQTSCMFRETIALHSLLEGNGRAAIVRPGQEMSDGSRASKMELIPLHPECSATGMLMGEKIHATRPNIDDRLRLFFRDIHGEWDSQAVISLDDHEVLHIPGLSYDGISGLPLRRVAQRNLNTAIDSEKRLAGQMANGFSGSLMLEAPTGLFPREEDAKQFLAHFEERHNSPDKAGKPGLLREGMKVNVLSSTNRDTEMHDNRKFARQDAALWLGLEQILGDDSSVSYNSLEQKNLAYLMNCLNRWLKRWEEEMEYKLLPQRQWSQDTHYIRFNTAALLKSDYKTSVESLSMALSATIINRNEAREKLDLLPVEGGDEFENPNITPGGDSGDTGGDGDGSPDPMPETDEGDEGGEMSAAIRSRLEQLIGVEANRVKQAAGRSEGKNYVAWLDDFYCTNWEPKLANWLEEVGMDRGLATAHCDESRRRLLEVCDYSNQETLASNVGKCVSDWKLRANTIGEVHV